jgi:hypothetical protein
VIGWLCWIGLIPCWTCFIFGNGLPHSLKLAICVAHGILLAGVTMTRRTQVRADRKNGGQPR